MFRPCVGWYISISNVSHDASSLVYTSEGGRVHAVPEASGLWAIIEDVSEMRTAVPALHFGPPHQEAVVALLSDAPRSYWFPETGPTSSRLELGIRVEQWIPADDALIDASFVAIPVLPREGHLSPFVDADVILLRRETQFELHLVLLEHGFSDLEDRIRFSRNASQIAGKSSLGPVETEVLKKTE